MSEFKGTPGPWTVSENAYGKVFVHGGRSMKTSVGTEYRELIAGGNNNNTLKLSNARLIAGAPDLLKAASHARIMIDHFIHGEESEDALHEAHAELTSAIAKALGEQK